MKLLEQIKQMKEYGKTIEEIAKILNQPLWIISILYKLV